MGKRSKRNAEAIRDLGDALGALGNMTANERAGMRRLATDRHNKTFLRIEALEAEAAALGTNLAAFGALAADDRAAIRTSIADLLSKPPAECAPPEAKAEETTDPWDVWEIPEGKTLQMRNGRNSSIRIENGYFCSQGMDAPPIAVVARLLELAKAPALADGWQVHKSGQIPCEPSALVDVVLRDGTKRIQVEACDLVWRFVDRPALHAPGDVMVWAYSVGF